MIPSKPSSPPLDRTVPLAGWANTIVLWSTLLILVATLAPFNFTPASLSVGAVIQGFLASPSDLGDIVSNVVLFMPYGVGIAALMRKRGWRLMITIVTALLASTALSFSVEMIQIFVPSRISSVIDVCTNSTGGLIGALSYAFWCVTLGGRSPDLAPKLKRLLSGRVLASALIGWVILTCLVALFLIRGAQLRNWDTSFPLMLGNEQTNDRPWQGTVSSVAIFDRALSPTEISAISVNQALARDSSLVANYPLTGRGNYRDQIGNLPDLIWQGSPTGQPNGLGIPLAADHWLSTQVPAEILSERLRKTSQFTLSAIVATTDFTQNGPARIISLSANPYNRNFTLGQDKDHLTFRLRNPVNGLNGIYAELFEPNIFKDAQPHHLVVTYDRTILTLYVDSSPRSTLAFTPDVTLFRYIFPFEGRSIHLTSWSKLVYQLMYYLLFFIPLGILWGLTITLFKSKSQFYVLVVGLGIIVPALILEVIIQDQLILRPVPVVMSAVIASGTAFLIHQRFTSWLRSASIY